MIHHNATTIIFRCRRCSLRYGQRKAFPHYYVRLRKKETPKERGDPKPTFKPEEEDGEGEKGPTWRITLYNMLRSRKISSALIISLIILGLSVASWGNFFAQLIMPSFVDTRQVENGIFSLINEERALRGFPTLLEDEALKTIALGWSEHLTETGILEHGDFASRVSQIGYSGYRCGEIIAMYGGWTLNLGRQFVDMWLDSPRHYAIMMTASSGFMGVGVSRGFFAVVDFRFA